MNCLTYTIPLVFINELFDLRSNLINSLQRRDKLLLFLDRMSNILSDDDYPFENLNKS